MRHWLMDGLPSLQRHPEASTQDLTLPGDGWHLEPYRVFDASLDLYFALDREGRVVYANRAQLAQWGRSAVEVAGKRLADIGYTTEVAAEAERALQAILKQPASLTIRLDY